MRRPAGLVNSQEPAGLFVGVILMSSLKGHIHIRVTLRLLLPQSLR
jgi:hypothetical protein